MTELFMYLIKATIVFTVLFVVYKLVLSKLTFHAINRLLLIALLPLSLLLPFSNYLLPNTFRISEEIPFMEELTLSSIVEVPAIIEVSQSASINYWEIGATIYFFIVFLLLFRSIATIRNLWILKNTSQKQRKERYHFIEVETAEVFSFFGWIFIPKGTLEDINPIIVKHEKIHAQLKHSFDIIITEIYAAFFWFNPLMYNFKNSLKSTHEFQVDSKLLKKEVQPLEYMQLLLQSLTGKKQEPLCNYFNHPILKKRVEMMTKTQSNKLSGLKYFFLAPIFAFLFFAFSKADQKEIKLTAPTEVLETSEKITLLFPVKNGSRDDISSFFGKSRKHPVLNVKKVHSGIDIKAEEGVPVLASEDGFILIAAKKKQWGNLIVIKHTNGYETRYAHLQGFNTQEKRQVKKGDVIGYVGNTGFSSGSHLHFELIKKGKRIDPLDHIE